MDRGVPLVLPGGPSSQSRLPRQVRGCAQAALDPRQATVRRHASGTNQAQALPAVPAPAVYQAVGRLCQAALCRSGACSPLSGPLHSPCRNLQPSPRSVQGGSSLLPLEGLRCRWQAEGHDRLCGGDPATLPDPRTAQGLGPHPPLRPLRQPQTSCIVAALPLAARHAFVLTAACTTQPTELSVVLLADDHPRTDDLLTTSLPFNSHVAQHASVRCRQLLTSP